MRRKYLLIVLAIFFVFTNCSYFYSDKQNVVNEGFLYIYPEASYKSVLDSIAPYLKDLNQFDIVAQANDYDKFIKPGKYKINQNETNKELVDKLKKGREDEVKVMVSNSPTIFHMARNVSKNIIADSTSIVNAILENPYFKEKKLNIETVKIYFLPNTYHFLWLTDGKGFVKRMISEHNKFWNKKRKQKLAEINMSELEVYTLASIVQMEASKTDEQPKIAQAYLNRLKKGMKLEADPTSVYAYKLEHGFDNKIQRVYHKHLETTSDYNTYLNHGLPPSPICLPNTTAIDAVLSPEKHDFVFFVADPEKPGYHSFSSTYSEHKTKAKIYRTWLNKNNIK